MNRVRELLDVEILLHLARHIGQEGPLRAHRVAKLVEFEQAVSGDGDDLGVGDGDLGVEARQVEVLLVVLRAEVPARQHQDERVVALQLAEPAPRAGVIGQLIVGKPGARNDVCAHDLLL